MPGFYASGFLYHPASGQILLQQQNSPGKAATWSLLGSLARNGETSQENFQRLVQTFLKIKLSTSAIHFVYDYFHKGLHKKHHVSYAEVEKLNVFPPTKKMVFAWFSIKEITKLPLSAQTKQDIIVGQRVIDSSVRKKAGELTIG